MYTLYTALSAFFCVRTVRGRKYEIGGLLSTMGRYKLQTAPYVQLFVKVYMIQITQQHSTAEGWAT